VENEMNHNKEELFICLNFTYKVGSMKVKIPQTDINPQIDISLENVEIEVKNLDLKDVTELIKTVKELTSSDDFNFRSSCNFNLSKSDFSLTK
jgi:hypothetical protein